MFKLLARLSARPAVPATPAPKTKLGMDVLEGRDCPAVFTFGSHVMLNPQPLPPGESVMLNPQHLAPKVFSPAHTHGIIIVGG